MLSRKFVFFEIKNAAKQLQISGNFSDNFAIDGFGTVVLLDGGSEKTVLKSMVSVLLYGWTLDRKKLSLNRWC